jgi:hypothetical protein
MDLIASRKGMIAGAEADAHDYAVAVVVGLNWLYGIRADNVVIGSIAGAQRKAHAVLLMQLSTCMLDSSLLPNPATNVAGAHLRTGVRPHD